MSDSTRAFQLCRSADDVDLSRSDIREPVGEGDFDDEAGALVDGLNEVLPFLDFEGEPYEDVEGRGGEATWTAGGDVDDDVDDDEPGTEPATPARKGEPRSLGGTGASTLRGAFMGETLVCRWLLGISKSTDQKSTLRRGSKFDDYVAD